MLQNSWRIDHIDGDISYEVHSATDGLEHEQESFIRFEGVNAKRDVDIFMRGVEAAKTQAAPTNNVRYVALEVFDDQIRYDGRVIWTGRTKGQDVDKIVTDFLESQIDKTQAAPYAWPRPQDDDTDLSSPAPVCDGAEKMKRWLSNNLKHKMTAPANPRYEGYDYVEIPAWELRQAIEATTPSPISRAELEKVRQLLSETQDLENPLDYVSLRDTAAEALAILDKMMGE